jgi:hypothetical protein
MRVIYGNPFTASSNVPFSHFEGIFQIGASVMGNWLDWTLLTDGYLISWNPVYTEKDQVSTGATLHYDLIAGTNMNFSGNSLDWSAKWKRSWTQWTMWTSAHAGWTMFGASQYYPDPNNREDKGKNDYGTGANAKWSIGFYHDKFGSFTLGIHNYFLYMSEYVNHAAMGWEFLHFSYLEYSRPLTKKVSFTLNTSLTIKTGDYYHIRGLMERSNRVMAYFQYNFVKKPV